MNISKLSENVKNYKIIGFGECAHWVSIINKYRIDLFKKLHMKYNWKLFFYEADIYIASIIDSYINGLITNINSIYMCIPHPFRDNYNITFIEWCKNRNKNLSINNRIHIYGWDCQPLFKNKCISKNKQISNLKKNITTFFPSLNLNKINKYYDEIEKIPYNSPKYGNTRDRNSYYIIKEFISILPNSDKLYLIGHNLHLHIKKYDYSEGNKVIRLGYYLDKYYKYLSIGSDILSGKVICNIEKNFNWNGKKIIKRLEKQKNNIKIIKPSNKTKHLFCSEMTDQKLLNSKNRHHLIIRFIKDKPWTHNLQTLKELRFQ